jgi:hypothetical protein
LLPFNEEHRSLGIDGGGFYFVQFLSGNYGKITEKMFFPHRTREAIIKNIESIRGAHWAPLSTRIVAPHLLL